MLKTWRDAALVLASTWLLWACATPPTPGTPDAPAAPDTTLAPNANLVVQGIPAIPMALVRKVERYTDFRGHAFVDWHPTRSEMLVAHRGAGGSVTQIYRLTKPLAQPEPLTEGADAVRSASYEPRDGRYIVFTRSTGGDEANQLYRLDLPGRQATLLTHPQEAHSAVGWVRGNSQLVYTSVPLDRTAQGGTRAAINTTLSLIDPLDPQASRRVLATLPGPGWFGGGVSEDGRHAAMVNYRSAAESHLWLVDLASGERRQLLPAAGEVLKAAHFSAGFSADGRKLYVVSDRASEFRELMALDLASGALQRISAHIPWDVSGGAVSRDSRWLATQVNNDGREEIHLFDARTLQALPPPAAPAGRIGSMAFHRSQHLLAYSLDSARGPSQLHVYDPATGRSQAWTQTSAPSGVDPAQFAEQTVVRWKSFDGRTISGLLSAPPARFSGKRPVIINIHGGPEAQAQMGFNGRWNYFVHELGIALIEPNVRGSAGYGKTFLSLDDGVKREDSVKDISALLDWIATQPNLDASRVLVAGGSYGGYMALAVSVHESARIAGGISVVGISNFVSFLTRTESYRRDLRRVEYGDEREPQMRAFLERISPLNNAERIKKPLFVVQGKNDPRVPYTESEQIVERVRANGLPVWYLRAENEGHGFARKENADFQFYAMVKFVEQNLLK